MQRVSALDESNRKMEIRFSDYKEVKEKGMIPYYREYDIPIENNQTVHFKFELTAVDFDKPSRINFYIPDEYEEIR